MYSAIGLAVLNALFMAITMWWGSKFSLGCKNSKNKTALMLPMILMLPRMLLAFVSTMIGMKIFGWDTTAGSWFVGTLLGLWILIMTCEVMYVQGRLAKRREKSEIELLRRRVRDLENEDKEMEETSSEQNKVPIHSRCSQLLIEHEARKTFRFSKV